MFPLLILDEVIFPHSKLVHHLGALLTHSFWLKSRWQLWPGKSLHGLILYTSSTFSSTMRLFIKSLKPWSSHNWTTMCFTLGCPGRSAAVLQMKDNGMSSNRHFKVCPNVTTVIWAALVANRLQGAIEIASHFLSSPSWHRPGYLRNCLSPVVYVCLACLDRKRLVHIPSVKFC